MDVDIAIPPPPDVFERRVEAAIQVWFDRIKAWIEDFEDEDLLEAMADKLGITTMGEDEEHVKSTDWIANWYNQVEDMTFSLLPIALSKLACHYESEAAVRKLTGIVE